MVTAGPEKKNENPAIITEIFWIEQYEGARLGTMARPRGGDWLEDEVRGWKRSGVDVAASALTDDEMQELDISDEGLYCGREGIEFVRFPIEDRSIPGSLEIGFTCLVMPLLFLL